MKVFQFEAELGTGYKTYNVIYDKHEDFEPISKAFLFDPKPIKSCWQPLEIRWFGDDNDYDEPYPPKICRNNRRRYILLLGSKWDIIFTTCRNCIRTLSTKYSRIFTIEITTK
ncbi:MAG: hypothetical protein LBK82_14895 [Planctomycetaceae bacterium]|jgi:hypothetical protein|nr:hypothetical protein [Planctomycetaceae bacterium]